MEVLFLGVGEACDPSFFNTSVLVRKNGAARFSIMLDCGFTTPHLFFRICDAPEALEVVWISHFHGDHFFGLPLLLLRFWEMGRRNPLKILGPVGVEDKVRQAMELAYPGFMAKLQFHLELGAMVPGEQVTAGGILWRCASVEHSQGALAVRLDCNDRAIFYSGDGRPTQESADLAKGVDLMIHEAFRYDAKTPGHGAVLDCVALAAQAGVRCLALVHLERNDRQVFAQGLHALATQTAGPRIVVPEPGESLRV